jgi:hypothetical protein
MYIYIKKICAKFNITHERRGKFYFAFELETTGDIFSQISYALGVNNYHNLQNYPPSCLLFGIQRFGD